MNKFDYEYLETAVGNVLRKQDNYNVGEHHFFPIGFLDRLAHFAQDLSVVENRRNPQSRQNSYGSDFDIWLDNMASKCVVGLRDGDRLESVPLINIVEMIFTPDKEVFAVLGDGRELRVMSGVSESAEPMAAASPEDFGLAIETDYCGSEPLEDIEGLASLFIRAGSAIGVDISNENRPLFENRIYDHFKFDLVPMLPYLLEDLETIHDLNLVRLELR